MMTRILSKMLASWLIRQGAISKSEESLYCYASYLVFSTMTPTVTVLLLGILIHISPMKCLLFSFTFIILRKFSGGFHFHSQITCFLVSTLVEFLFLIYSATGGSFLLLLIFVLSCISLAVFSPIVSSSRRITYSDYYRCRHTTRRILAIIAIICYFLYITGNKPVIPFFEYAVIMTAILQYPVLIKQRII